MDIPDIPLIAGAVVAIAIIARVFILDMKYRERRKERNDG
jgi:hypothetical protein